MLLPQWEGGLDPVCLYFVLKHQEWVKLGLYPCVCACCCSSTGCLVVLVMLAVPTTEYEKLVALFLHLGKSTGFPFCGSCVDRLFLEAFSC